jgi:hypothetical protein
MTAVVKCLRDLVRNYFTREFVSVDKPQASAQTTRKGRRRSRSMPPSERFVWSMVVLIVALAGLIGIELAIIIVTGTVNTEILIVVSGLVGALASRFLEAKL